MRKILATMLLITGFFFAGWNGYTWVTEASSGSEVMEATDIVSTTPTEENEPAERPAGDTFNETGSTATDNADVPEVAAGFAAEEEKEEPELRDYEEYDKGDEVGWLLVPSLDMKYPIYWGTDDDTLTQGVGYHEGDFTTPPDGLAHTVLSGHRDTVFRELGDLEEGEKIYVQFEDVQYEYEIQKTWITDAQDRTVIVNKDEPTLTLTTCYPFSFIGAAPDRYIIEAPLVSTTDMG